MAGFIIAKYYDLFFNFYHVLENNIDVCYTIKHNYNYCEISF